MAVRSGGESLPGPDTLRYAAALSDAAFGLAAIPFATLVVVVASLLHLRTRVVPRWVGWLGLGVTALSQIVIAPQIGPLATSLIVPWPLGVSARLLRERGTRAVPGMAQGQPAIPLVQQ